MRKLIAFTLVLTLLCFGAVGCGAKEKLEEKAAEKLTEKFLEQSGGDVDIDGDKITVTGEDGSSITFGGNEWPKSDLAKNIPEFKKGTISTTIESENHIWITIEEVKAGDAIDYIEKNKPDFTIDTFETKSGDAVAWSGKNEKGIHLSLSFEGSTLSLILYQEEDDYDSYDEDYE